MKYVILYYPFKYKENLNVGSGVRPANIKKAFEKKYDTERTKLIFISGSQQERLKQIKKIQRNLKPENILFCYIEFPNVPLLFSNENHIPVRPDVDLIWFKYCKKNKIPLGGFVRDIYWKFPVLYPMSNFKVRLNYYFSEIYLNIYKKYLNCMFLPSVEMNKYIGMDYKKVYALPSGGRLLDLKILQDKLTKEHAYLKAVYVGSLHETAGYKLMLKSFSEYNKDFLKIRLTMIVRENSYENIKNEFEPYLKEGWLHVKHLATSEHPEDLIEADFAVIPYPYSEYHDFAMPVKLIEYISFGLPILLLRNAAMNNFINNLNAGIIVENDLESFLEGLEKMEAKLDAKEFSKINIYKKFEKEHTWEHRVEEIEEALLSYQE